MHKKCCALNKNDIANFHVLKYKWQCRTSNFHSLSSITLHLRASYNSNLSCKCSFRIPPIVSSIDNKLTLLLTDNDQDSWKSNHDNFHSFNENNTVPSNFRYTVHDFHKLSELCSLNKHFSFFLTNICTLNANFDNLHDLLFDFYFDVIAITETWSQKI